MHQVIAAIAHITVIQIYCVIDNKIISPQTMNTDTVECFFGDARQMVGGSIVGGGGDGNIVVGDGKGDGGGVNGGGGVDPCLQ